MPFVMIDEHANAVCLIAADSGQYAVIIFQDDVSMVAEHWRIAVNCRVARKRLVAGISRTAIGTISNSAITLKIIQRFFEKNLGAAACWCFM